MLFLTTRPWLVYSYCYLHTPYERTPHAMFYWEQTGFIWSKQSYQSQNNGKLFNYMEPSDQETKESVHTSIVQL